MYNKKRSCRFCNKKYKPTDIYPSYLYNCDKCIYDFSYISNKCKTLSREIFYYNNFKLDCFVSRTYLYDLNIEPYTKLIYSDNNTNILKFDLISCKEFIQKQIKLINIT